MKTKLKRLLKNIVLPLSRRQTPAGELVTTPAAPRLEAPSGCFAGGYETAAVRWKSLLMAALCAVGCAAFAKEPGAVQLWEGGPYFATCNVGATTPEEYGILTNFNDAAKAVTDALGADWRVPSDAELKMLAGKNDGDKVCSNVWTTCNGVAGRRFFGMTSGYEDKSIFLPAAGCDGGGGREGAGDYGYYWSSEADDGNDAWGLYFYDGSAGVGSRERSNGFSVRAVKDPPSVTVGEVTTGEPWSTITVNYTLGGTDAKTDYKVAFDVTAGGKTAGVTNAAAKVTDGATNAVINTLALFGKEVVDTKAKVKVSLIAIKPFVPPAGQLWKDGPIWAECNVGGTVPGDYGELYKFNDNKAADAAKTLGDGWRLPSLDELSGLMNNCDRNWETCKNSDGEDITGYRFTGKGDYSSNSIFLPAAGSNFGNGREYAGEEGFYWSSEENGDDLAWNLYFYEGYASVNSRDRGAGMSVRAVRDAK